MLKYDSNNISKMNFSGNTANKAYFGGNVCYQYMTSGTPSRLPAGYTEVEYIQNISGTTSPTSTTKTNLAYIDTNYVPTEKTRVVTDMQIIQASQNPRYFGAGKWNSLGYLVSQEWTVGESRSKIYCKFGQSSGWIQTSYSPTLDRHTYDFNNNGKLLIDDVEITTLPTTSFTLDSSIVLFSASRANDSNYVDLSECVYAKLFASQVYDDGTLVRDLVPCTRDSDSVAGLYDIVNDVFYSSGNNNPLYAGNPV